MTKDLKGEIVKSSKTREEWLLLMCKYLKKRFNEKGYDIPQNIRVSCGLPSSRTSIKRKKRGEVYSDILSKDNHFEIFLSPTIDKSLDAAETLVHEMCHVSVGLVEKHGKVFRACCDSIGLIGNPTENVVGPDLKSYIELGLMFYGEYPHGRLDFDRMSKQPTRMLKAQCPNPWCKHRELNNRPYIVRVSESVLATGKPICGCCRAKMEVPELCQKNGVLGKEL